MHRRRSGLRIRVAEVEIPAIKAMFVEMLDDKSQKTAKNSKKELETARDSPAKRKSPDDGHGERLGRFAGDFVPEPSVDDDDGDACDDDFEPHSVSVAGQERGKRDDQCRGCRDCDSEKTL